MTRNAASNSLAAALVLWALGACSSDTDDAMRGAGATVPGATTSGTGNDAFGNATTDAAGATAAGDGAAGDLGGAGTTGTLPTTCASGVANTSPITPTVWLVLDGSGSMNEGFGGNETRWQALRSALMDPGGLVPTLEQGVRFGMVLYAGIDPQDGITGGLCVDLQIVDPALNNFATLDARFPRQELGGWTPTDRALEHVVNTLPVGTPQEVLDAEVSPTFVILATDGAPNDHCTDTGATMQNRGGGSSGQDPVVAQRVLDATTRGADLGMNLFIISLAGGDTQLQSHLEQVAATSLTATPPFVPATRDDLVATLQQIVGNATCQIQLDGAVTAGAECTGQVLLNGNPVPCNTADGYRMLDERTLQLTGAACDSFLGSESQVAASFPCGVFIPD